MLPRQQRTVFSFAEAGRAQVRGGDVWSIFRRTPETIELHVHGRQWRTYHVVELTTDATCSHCGRTAARGDQVVRFGRYGFFLCCLECVEWRRAA